MNEFYAEHLFKRKNTWKDYMIKAFVIVALIYSCNLLRIHPAFFVVVLLFAGLTVVVFFLMNVEYEYFYMNGYFEIDRIASKSIRRKVFEMKINELEVLVPEGGFEVQPYRSLKEKDFTSRRKDGLRYEMVISRNGKKWKILLEPSEMMVESMNRIAPKKVRVS